MKPLKLIARSETKTTPKSILCNDNKGEEMAVIWVDQTVSINGKDLYVDEMRQIVNIAENFFLFYNNIRTTPTAVLHIKGGTATAY